MSALRLVEPATIDGSKPRPQASITPGKPRIVPNRPMDAPYSALDRSLHAGLARLTAGLSPAALAGVYFDWAAHLAASQGKQLAFAGEAWGAAIETLAFAAGCAARTGMDPGARALPQDTRFRAPEWLRPPFNILAHAFLSSDRWREAATSGVRGASKRRQDVLKASRSKTGV